MKRDRTHLYISLTIFAAAALLVVCCSLAWGATVRLAWDHDGGAEGYRLYKGESGGPLMPDWQGAEKTTSVEVTSGITYQFYVTAYNGDMESAPSDIVQYTAPGERHTIIVPGRPSAIRIEFE